MEGSQLRVRAAYPREIATLVEFNRALAHETEGRELDAERLQRGVAAVFEDPARGGYFLALQGADPVGCLLLTSEWSDWRNGVFWWIQSVYVRPEWRGKGVFRSLYRHVLERARATPEVCGLRLYVDLENRLAQRVYRALGMAQAHYQMFELDFVLAERTGPPSK
jgi:GNAT superfamily N-acetyltransferase